MRTSDHKDKGRLPRGILGLAVVALVAGCSSGSKPREAGDRTPVTEQLTELSAELAALSSQLDTAIGECLESQGFEYFGKSALAHFESLFDLFSLRLQVISSEDANDRGYLSESSAVGLLTEDELNYYEKMTESETAAYQLARAGAPEGADRAEFTTASGSTVEIGIGGCVGVAAGTVYGSVDAYVDGEQIFEELQDMNGELLVRVEEDVNVKEAMKDWSFCMRDAGSHFNTPEEAREKALSTREEASGDDVGSVTAEEIKIASADAQCQEEVSLPRIYTDAVVRTQQTITSERERVFLAWDELMQRVEAEGYAGVRADGEGLLSGNSEPGS